MLILGERPELVCRSRGARSFQRAFNSFSAPPWYGVPPKKLRRSALWPRLEPMLLASGARYDIIDRESWGRLYRCADRVPASAWEACRARGVTAGVVERLPPERPSPTAEPYRAGAFARGGHRIALETGPALDPQSGAPAYFLELRPKYFRRMSAELTALLQEVEGLLRGLGATTVEPTAVYKHAS